MDKPMKPNLGKNQLSVLSALRRHGCYPGGWVWNTPSGTERILDSLVAAGYARKVACGMGAWGEMYRWEAVRTHCDCGRRLDRELMSEPCLICRVTAKAAARKEGIAP